MCKEKIRKIGAFKMSYGGDAEMIDTAAGDSLSPKESCLGNISALEATEASLKVSIVAPVKQEKDFDSKDQDDALLEPDTPILDGENSELSFSSGQTEDEDVSGCETPTKSMFDPFAPGPEDLALFAPKKNIVRDTRVPFQKQLNFDSCCDSLEKVEVDASKIATKGDHYLESINKSFLHLIVSTQLSEMPDVNLIAESDMDEILKTPNRLPFITGIAESCPGAPVRPTWKSRRLTDGICRKLEFGSNLL